MKIKLVVDGENQLIKVTPDNAADKKLLEFVAEKDTADVDVKRKLDYSDRSIEHINLVLKIKPVEQPVCDLCKLILNTVGEKNTRIKTQILDFVAHEMCYQLLIKPTVRPNRFQCGECGFSTDGPKMENCIACHMKGSLSLLVKVEGETKNDFKGNE